MCLRCVFCVVVAVLLPSLSLFAQAPKEPPVNPRASSKKLIEFGWDEPDPAFMRKHVAEMERTAFDGCVFHLTYAKPDGSPGSFIWEAWGERAFTEAELKASADDLKASAFTRFTHNFLRFNTAPGRVDWFADFGPILTNARHAARIAREGRCAGVLFDIEQYDGQLYHYRKQKDAATKSWDAYAAQTRQRGVEVMRAFQEGYPDLVVLLTWGHSLPYIESQGEPARLPDCTYGLLAPFMDGFLSAAEGKTKVVDGYESSYAYKDTSQFAPARQLMKEKVLSIVADDAKHRERVSAGFGVWMDNDWRRFGWDLSDFTRNYYTPEQFEATVRTAWETTDEYVWIYTETPRWWSEEGKPQKLPAEYDKALRRATGR